MAHWMRCQVHEETIHAMKFFDHIQNRGGKVTLPDIKQLKQTWKSPVEAWKDALDHEKFITGKIHDLVKLARSDEDFTAEPLLAWFVTEQIEEEANAEKIVQKLAMIGDSKEGLYMTDRELAARVFVPGSCFDPAAYSVAT
jgi:ferritin